MIERCNYEDVYLLDCSVVCHPDDGDNKHL
jgi:hypothetical protein